MSLPATQLQQQPPLFDIATVEESTTYQNQLVVTGGTFPYTFETTNGSSHLTVYSNGQIASTGPAPIGTYIISGIVFDNNGNSGQWMFTLQVTAGPSSPETTITPVEAALPTGVEIKVPFQIDMATGGVSYLFDYKTIIAQHIETICLTLIGERVMNPQYGTTLEAQIFEPMIEANLALLSSDIQGKVSALEPRVRVISVQVSAAQASSGVLNVTVNYQILPFNDWNTLQITTGGTITQVNSL